MQTDLVSEINILQGALKTLDELKEEELPFVDRVKLVLAKDRIEDVINKLKNK